MIKTSLRICYFSIEIFQDRPESFENYTFPTISQNVISIHTINTLSSGRKNRYLLDFANFERETHFRTALVCM